MSSENELINTFLADNIDENTANGNNNNNNASSNQEQGNTASKANSAAQSLRNSGRASHADHNDENYDYERQESPQRFPGSNSQSSALPSASYIPQYTVIDHGMQYPYREVVSNAAVSTGIDSNNMNDSTAAGLRARAPTVSANVLNIDEFYYPNTNEVRSSHTNNNHTNNHTINDDNKTNNTNSRYSQRESQDGRMSGRAGTEEPMSVPLMVKPKTLYQNPQTPTVLPSTYHPINRWSSIKQRYLKEFLAEFLGTMIMVLVGNAVCCQVNLAGASQQIQFQQALNQMRGTVSDETLEVASAMQDIVSSISGGTFDDIPLAWGAAVVMGYFCSGGSAISGAHLNPSVTVSNWVFRGLPTKKVPVYIFGQLLGAFAGGLICFIFYKRVITELFPDNAWRTNVMVANNFVTFPKPYLSSARQFVSEFVATAVFQACIFAMTDPYTVLATEMFPLMLFILIFGLNASVGLTTGCAINLARDLGPRLSLYAVGFDRRMLWVDNAHYFWVPMTAPIIGAIFGSLLYDICIYQGHESPVNWPLTVYKEKLLRFWMRRLGGMRRTRHRATSDLSEFSYRDDDLDNHSLSDADSKNGILKKTRTKTQSSDDDLDEDYVQKNVKFQSVSRDKRGYTGIPTILEEDTESSLDNDTDSMELSSVSTAPSASLPTFTPTANN